MLGATALDVTVPYAGHVGQQPVISTTAIDVIPSEWDISGSFQSFLFASIKIQ
jgi:hypothetical protein